MRIEEKERPGDASMGSTTDFEQVLLHYSPLECY
jgi:hypothetical protein